MLQILGYEVSTQIYDVSHTQLYLEHPLLDKMKIVVKYLKTQYPVFENYQLSIMFQSTRRRLAIWYTAVTAILLLLFASAVYLYVRSTLIERIDDTLNHVVEVVERSLIIESVNSPIPQMHVNIESSLRNNADNSEDDRIDLEWFSPNGELLWSTFSQTLNIPIRGNYNTETVKILDLGKWGEPEQLLRQVTKRIELGRQVLGYLRVSHPWFEVTKPSRQLIFDLAVGTIFMVLSVGASGWFLSGKAMQPVGESYQRLKQFTADASHELRSPIALIQTNVQVALSDLQLIEKGVNNFDNQQQYQQQYKQQLQLIEKLTKRLGNLVNDLLFLARQDSGISNNGFTICPLDALLIEVVEEQQLIAQEKQVNLILDLVDPGTEINDQLNDQLLENWFSVMGNWQELGRLFTNLISNALQYTHQGGVVKIKLVRKEGINHRRYDPSYLQIQVIDTGIGIPPEALPHLFDRFYRVDPARTHSLGKTGIYNGTGLGLAIAHAIVEHHQGNIKVASIINQGTTFTITLPCVDLFTSDS